MMTKACMNSKVRSANKYQNITHLIQESSAEANSPIIKELAVWQQKFTPNLTQEATKELAAILIRNYLQPSADLASLFIKMSLPEIFNKEELENLLAKGDFSEEEKADFEQQYLKNTRRTDQQYQLTTFFSQGNYADVQKLFLSDLPSQDLISLTTTSKFTQKIIIDILFERNDKIANEFKEKTLENWFMQLRHGEPLDNLIPSQEKNRWIGLITKHLKSSETVVSCKMHCSMLLQYLRDNDSEKIDSCLAKAVTRVKTLDNEAERKNLLRSLELRTKFEERHIVTVLNAMGYYNERYRPDYELLVSMAADFNEEQLNRAVISCFENACEVPYDSKKINSARKALVDLMKQVPSLSRDSLHYFVKMTDDFSKARYAFLVLFLLAKNNNPEFFELLTKIATNSKRHSIYWLCLLAPHLKQVDDNFISTLIENIDSDLSEGLQNAKRALNTIARKLTTHQLAKYSHQFLSLLGKEKKEELIRGCKTISALAAPLSPCPYEIIQKLISFAKHEDKDVAKAATNALFELEPNILLLQSGVLEKELTNPSDHNEAYNYIIKLAPLVSSEDITDSFIHKLIQSYTGDTRPSELMMKAVAAIRKKLNDQQIDIFVARCTQNLQGNKGLIGLSLLQALPISMLTGKLDGLFTICANQMKTEEDRHFACTAIVALESLSPLFPDNLLVNFISLLNDKNKVIRSGVARYLPQVLHLIKKESLADIFNQITSHLSDYIIKLTPKYTSEILCMIVPGLTQQNLAQAKELLIKSLDHNNKSERRLAFKVLTELAHHLEGKELTSLISVLIANCRTDTCEYIPNIVDLLTKDSLATVFELAFANRNTNDISTLRAALLTINKIAHHPELSKELLRKIISNFINILSSQTTDMDQESIDPDLDYSENEEKQELTDIWRTSSLDILIDLVDLITPEEFEIIQNLPATSSYMIASQHALETLYEAKPTKECNLGC